MSAKAVPMTSRLHSHAVAILLVSSIIVTNLLNSRAVFLGHNGMWGIGGWHWGVMASAILAATWVWMVTHQRWYLVMTLGAVAFDVGWHLTNQIDTAYLQLVNPGYLLLNMAAITTIWEIGRHIRRDMPHTHQSALVLTIPSVLGWNIFVSHSPLTAVYAEIYGGGDTLIGQGSSSLYIFVAMVSGAWIWMRLKAVPFGSFTLLSAILVLSQTAIKGEWRFVPVVIMAAFFAELVHRRWPHHWHRNSILWTCCFGGGYFATLAFTTSIAWETSIWTGILTIMILISVALARISNPYSTPAGAI